jgi:hypothetical protein
LATIDDFFTTAGAGAALAGAVAFALNAGTVDLTTMECLADDFVEFRPAAFACDALAFAGVGFAIILRDFFASGLDFPLTGATTRADLLFPEGFLLDVFATMNPHFEPKNAIKPPQCTEQSPSITKDKQLYPQVSAIVNQSFPLTANRAGIHCPAGFDKAVAMLVPVGILFVAFRKRNHEN